MECTQCQLCTRLTDRLRSNYTHSLAFLNHAVIRKVTSVTFSTNTFLRFARQNRTNLHLFDRRILYLLGNSFGNFFTGVNQYLVSQRIHYIVNRHTS